MRSGFPFGGERPVEDYDVNRPEVYEQKCFKLTGTNGQSLDHIYPSLSRHRNWNRVDTTRLAIA